MCIQLLKRLTKHGFRVGILWGKLGREAGERDAVKRLQQHLLDFALTTSAALVGDGVELERCEMIINSNAIRRVVVDEAHAISEQGFDFKKDYQRLCCFKAISQYLQIVAMTATLTAAAKTDVVKHLNLHLDEGQNWVRGKVSRPELTFEVFKPTSRKSIKSWLK